MKMKAQDKTAGVDDATTTSNAVNYKTYFLSEMRGDINWNNQP